MTSMLKKEFRVNKETDPKKLAGAINSYFNKNFYCTITAIGQKSITLATKALALLNCMFKRDYACKMDYLHITKDGDELTGIVFRVERL